MVAGRAVGPDLGGQKAVLESNLARERPNLARERPTLARKRQNLAQLGGPGRAVRSPTRRRAAQLAPLSAFRGWRPQEAPSHLAQTLYR